MTAKSNHHGEVDNLFHKKGLIVKSGANLDKAGTLENCHKWEILSLNPVIFWRSWNHIDIEHIRDHIVCVSA